MRKMKDEKDLIEELKTDEKGLYAEIKRLNLVMNNTKNIISEKAFEKLHLIEEKKILKEVIEKARFAVRKASKDGYNTKKYKHLEEVQSEAERTLKTYS